MTDPSNLSDYAAKMRRMSSNGTDLAVDARFVDMLAPRRATVLDIGCGIGNAVAALRTAGHETFGIDPAPEVLQVARELHEVSWFHELSATELTSETLADRRLPTRFDIVLMSGNVPAFLSESELAHTISVIAGLLAPGGRLVVGTTTHRRGGPADLDDCAAATSLSLTQRYSDWHLGDFEADSPWSVSVYVAPGIRHSADGPDGIHALRDRDTIAQRHDSPASQMDWAHE
ncbi:class I SAM-dependent methyltransferase [Brevibacterium sediminis]|uniref:class I SAM-dependent methyltransferase n=1 Tax=Brevibacterium sediminis TaxID=1857024 RepID=UPI002174DCE6|nr:class I SAM-dependent methyltransferase [Brevibacterium sediminis]MCS4592281.1 class I SAM-dependent methyltransferase [Brevibacterium sediminis]